MLASDVIEASESPWSAPVVMVRKKDGTLRFYVNYRDGCARVHQGVNTVLVYLTSVILLLGCNVLQSYCYIQLLSG